MTFESELQHLINRYSMENASNTPDYILAKYLNGCLNVYNATLRERDAWFGVDVWKKTFGESHGTLTVDL